MHFTEILSCVIKQILYEILGEQIECENNQLPGDSKEQHPRAPCSGLCIFREKSGMLPWNWWVMGESLCEHNVQCDSSGKLFDRTNVSIVIAHIYIEMNNVCLWEMSYARRSLSCCSCDPSHKASRHPVSRAELGQERCHWGDIAASLMFPVCGVRQKITEVKRMAVIIKPIANNTARAMQSVTADLVEARLFYRIVWLWAAFWHLGGHMRCG